MKKLIVVSISLLLVMTVAKVLFAAEEMTSSKTRQITGNVTAIDTGSNTVTGNSQEKRQGSYYQC